MRKNIIHLCKTTTAYLKHALLLRAREIIRVHRQNFITTKPVTRSSSEKDCAQINHAANTVDMQQRYLWHTINSSEQVLREAYSKSWICG